MPDIDQAGGDRDPRGAPAARTAPYRAVAAAATQKVPSRRMVAMLSPNTAMAPANIAGAPIGCMSQTATSGQSPRSQAWACTRYSPSSVSMTETRKPMPAA